ncbi:MAG: helicase [Nitrospinae bacterium]|nr:helicase [Nitrospinota bacterium]
MPRVNSFKVNVQTGSQGMNEPVYFNFNNHKLEFENVNGSAESGKNFEGDFEVNSFAHSLTLVGPQSGKWDIEKISVEYNCENEKPYTVRFGAVTLDETTEVNIWQDPPVPAIDV